MADKYFAMILRIIEYCTLIPLQKELQTAFIRPIDMVGEKTNQTGMGDAVKASVVQ